MKSFLVFINTILYSLSLSCADDNQNKINTDDKNGTAKFDSSANTGSYFNDTLPFEKFADIINFFGKKIDSFDRLKVNASKLKKSGIDLSLDSIQFLDSSYYDMVKKRNNSIYKYIATKKDAESLGGLIYLVIDRKTSIALIDNLFHVFPINLQGSTNGKWLLGKIKERKEREMQSVYNPAILNIKFKSSDGKTISLNEINSKYLLLDFWASWCLPCRYENRVLVKEKDLITKGINISIVAISLDNNGDKWLKACKEDNLNYLSLCDFKELGSPIVKELKIEKIPRNVLISKDGKILANNLWDDELTKFIKSLP